MSLPLCVRVYVQGSVCAAGRPGPSDRGVFREGADERGPQHSGEHVQVGWKHCQNQIFVLGARRRTQNAIYLIKSKTAAVM